MMTWAETAAKREKITREEADRWALRSHQRAIAAQDAGKFTDEIVPVPIGKDKKSGETAVSYTHLTLPTIYSV